MFVGKGPRARGGPLLPLRASATRGSCAPAVPAGPAERSAPRPALSGGRRRSQRWAGEAAAARATRRRRRLPSAWPAGGSLAGTPGELRRAVRAGPDPELRLAELGPDDPTVSLARVPDASRTPQLGAEHRSTDETAPKLAAPALSTPFGVLISGSEASGSCHGAGRC